MAEKSKKMPARRGWVFRVSALLVGLLPFFILEGVLRLGDWERPDPSEDPFVGFASVRPLFALNAAGTHYGIAPNRGDWFYPVEFKARKGGKTVRIFCIGGSTVAGRPYTVETAFSSWMQVYLRELDPSRDWEVVNCGGISYASYRLVPIVKEVLEHYEPDLLVLYTGHNEFLEDRTYEPIKNLPAVVTKPYELASNWHTFNLLRRGFLRLTGRTSPSVMQARAIMPEEVDALLEHKGAMEHYYRDEAWQQSVFDHYEFNLNWMCSLARKAAVPMIVMNPCSNLRDIRPFKSEHRAGLTEPQRQKVASLINQAGRSFSENQPERASILYEAALELDPLYADTHYQYAKLLDLVNDMGAAYGAYVRAKDLDVCPLRMLEPMHELLAEVVARHGVTWLDVRAEVEKIVQTGIPGKDEFLDHVHPNPAGHQFIASLVVEKMAEMGYLKIGEPIWLPRIRPAIERHLRSLPEGHFAQGNIRLENLRQWARGRSEAEPPVESKRRKPSAKGGSSSSDP